jgi:hypothetical protein
MSLVKHISPNKFLWTPVSKSIHIILNMQKTCTKFNLCPEEKYVSYSANFRETHTCLMALCQYLLYQIPPELVKECGRSRQKPIYALQ